MVAHHTASRRLAAALCVVVLLSLLAPARARASAAAAAASGNGAASAGGGDESTTGGFAPLLDSSSAALAERTALRSLPGVLALRGTTLSCADISIGQTGTALSDMGDGFASLDAGEAGALDALIQSIGQGGSNGTFPLSASQLAGANVWLLEHIADVAGVGVTYTSVVLPSSLAGNRTAQVSYLFATLGYDCMVSSTAVRSDMLPFADFLLPNEQYGLSVVTQLVAGSSAPILTVLFSWTSPFSAEIWYLIAASLVFGALVMYVFEGHDRHEDYGAADLMILLRIGRGCYKAFMNFCAVGGFTPNTPASQTFNIAFAFSMLLLQATYTANLAAYFVGTRTPTGAVSSMASFGAKQLSACVMPDPYVVRLLRTNYPLTSLVVMPASATTADLLDAVLNGTCAGAVASNLDLRFAMGPRDAAGVYCDMELVGPLISQGAMAVPFNRGTVTPAALSAMNAIVSSAYALGDYATGASAVSFAESRSYCSAGAGLSSGGPLAALTLTQVSGIFFVLLFGAIVAGAVFAFFHVRARLAGEAILEEEPADKGDASTRNNGMVSREEAVSALCAAVAREAATALQVPPRVAAAAERARAERGAALHATLQLIDVDGARFGKAFVAELVNAPDWLFLLTRLAPDDALRLGSAIRALAAGGPPPGTGGALAKPSGDPSADALAKARDPWPYFASVSHGGANGAPGNYGNRAKQQGGPPMGMPSFSTGLSNFAAFFSLPSAAPQPSRRLPTPVASSRSLAPSEAPSDAPAPLDRSLERSRSRSQSQSRRAGSSAASEPAVSLVSRARTSFSVGAGERRSTSTPRPRASSTASATQRRSDGEEEDDDEPPRSPARSSFLGSLRRAESAKSPTSRIPRFSSHARDDLV